MTIHLVQELVGLRNSVVPLQIDGFIPKQYSYANTVGAMGWMKVINVSLVVHL